MRSVCALSCLLALLTAPPAAAVESASRLVPGGASASAHLDTVSPPSDSRLPLYTSGGYSLGLASETARGPGGLPVARGTLAIGGYVAYGFNETRLSATLTNDGLRNHASLSASRAGMFGLDAVATMRLGAGWDQPSAGFSPNLTQPSSLSLSPDLTDERGRKLNLSLSLSQDISPSLSFGGMAEANQPLGNDQAPAFRFGAGLGYRF